MSTTTRLRTLAERINVEHHAFETTYGAAINHAREAGRLLLEAKAKLDYGQWTPWLTENVEFSERTARVYMQIADAEPDQERQSSADSIAQALRHLSKPRQPSTSEVTSMLREQADPDPTPGPAPSTRRRPLTEWSDAQQRKRARAGELLAEAQVKLEVAHSGKLSPYGTSEVLREAGTMARHASAMLEELAFSFEQ